MKGRQLSETARVAIVMKSDEMYGDNGDVRMVTRL